MILLAFGLRLRLRPVLLLFVPTLWERSCLAVSPGGSHLLVATFRGRLLEFALDGG